MKPGNNKKPIVNGPQKKQAINQPVKKTEPKFTLPDTKKWAILIGLAIFTFILYGNTIGHDYALDDDIITRRNAFVQEGTAGIGHIFSKGFLYGFNHANDQSYRPVTLTSIAIEKQFFGNNPHIHHFFNVFWYAITAIFLFLTLVKIFRKYNYIVPLLITLLYIAHPVHTEVVANIKSRDEILSFLFCIMALYFSLDYYLYSEQVKSKPRRIPVFATNPILNQIISGPDFYKVALSWLFFFLAILSKETVLMYAIIIPMVYYFFTDFKIQKIVMLAVPFALLVGFYMIIRGKVLDSITFNEKMEVINNTLMAAKSGGDRLATTLFILGKYVWLLFVPVTLSWDYSYNQIPIVSFGSWQALVSILIYAGMAAYAIYRLKKKDPVSFGILYYIITMALVSNLFIKIGSSMGERFLYTSSLGFCIAIGFLIIRALKVKADTLRPNLTTLYAVAGVILLLFSIKTIARNSDWKNNFTLFESGVSTSPNSARARQSMAITYTDTANKTMNPVEKAAFFNKAITEYNAALRILPDYSEALYNKGWNYYSMQNFDSAEAAFQKCLQADNRYTNAYNNLGVIYFNQKKYPKAIAIFEKAITINPNDAQMYANAGAAFFNINRMDSCIYYSQKAISIDPQLNIARENLVKAQNALRGIKR